MRRFPASRVLPPTDHRPPPTAFILVPLLLLLLLFILSIHITIQPLPFLPSIFSSSPLPPTSDPSLSHALHTLSAYRHRNLADVRRKRNSFRASSARHRAFGAKIGYPDKLDDIEEAIWVNEEVVRDMLELGKGEMDGWREDGRGQRRAGLEHHRVVEVLKHFVRDWSHEGRAERDLLFQPIFSALETYGSTGPHDQIRVLVPGCGLGRLAYEVAERGYLVDANDLSHYMTLGVRLVLPSKKDQFTVKPWAHSMSHHVDPASMLRTVTFPDIQPRPQDRLVLHQGDFTQLFSASHSHDIVVTLFFLDTAFNILDYLETIWNCLRPGGLWINEGPLLWSGDPRMELSLDELVRLSELIGFTPLERSTVSSEYTADTLGLFAYVYSAQFWVMRKPAE